MATKIRPVASVGHPLVKSLDDYAEASTLSAPEHRLRVLLICDYQPQNAGTVCEHIESFSRYSRHEFYTYSGKGDLPLSVNLDRFDAIIIHYSIFACIDAYLSPLTRYRIRKFKGLKALFIQDEYRFIHATIQSLEYLGIDILFTVVPVSEIEKVYPLTCLEHVWRVNVLTGYINEDMLAVGVPLLAERPIDVGYRGRKYPAWHGQLGLEKWQIGRRFHEDAQRYALHCDISCSEKDRLYGQKWIDFICRTKAQLGVESGASVMDFSGEISRRCEDHERQHPDTPYEELRRLYFQEEEGKIRLNQIAPRMFESIALKSLLILYEGEYSEILEPWRHFVPLRKDHANMHEVVAVLRDLNRAQAIVNCAFNEIARDPRHSYRGFVGAIDQVLSDRFQPHMSARETAPPGKGAGTLNFVTGDAGQPVTIPFSQWWSRRLYATYAVVDAQILMRLPDSSRRQLKYMLRHLRHRIRNLLTDFKAAGTVLLYMRSGMRRIFVIAWRYKSPQGYLSMLNDLYRLSSLVRLRESLSDRLHIKTTRISYQRTTGTVFIHPDDAQISEARTELLDRAQLCQLLAEKENVKLVWRQGHELGLGKIYPSNDQLSFDILPRVAHKLPKEVASALD